MTEFPGGSAVKNPPAVCVCILSHFSPVRLCATPQTVTHQDPLSMGFPRQQSWNGLPFPPPGNLPNPGIKPTSSVSPARQADSLPSEPPEKPQE